MRKMDIVLHFLVEFCFFQTIHNRTFNFGKVNCNSSFFQSQVNGFETWNLDLGIFNPVSCATDSSFPLKYSVLCIRFAKGCVLQNRLAEPNGK